MTAKYEKPLIIPFDTDKDDTGMGACAPTGSAFITGHCNPMGTSAGKNCKNGGIADQNCISGSGP